MSNFVKSKSPCRKAPLMSISRKFLVEKNVSEKYGFPSKLQERNEGKTKQAGRMGLGGRVVIWGV